MEQGVNLWGLLVRVFLTIQLLNGSLASLNGGGFRMSRAAILHLLGGVNSVLMEAGKIKLS